MSDSEKDQLDTMADEFAELPTEQPSPDEHTTEPNPTNGLVQPPQQQESGKWQMPKPRFQQSSGYLPQGYLKEIGIPESSDVDKDEISGIAPLKAAVEADAAAVPDSPTDIEPQPDLSEQLVPEKEVVTKVAPVQQKSMAARIFGVIIGVLAILLFISLFLAAVYFLFLKGDAGSNIF